jgi:hypothetical protein
MIDFYPQAKQLLVDQSRVFIGALANIPQSDLSIVIHKTACDAPCTAESVANSFATDTNGASTHFIVGLDGEVVQCVRLSDGAGGNCCLEAGHDTYWDPYQAKYGNLNLCTFSIEHVDVTIDNSETPTQAQLNSSFILVLWLCQQFGITADRIKPHSSLDPITRALCPGNYPLDSLLTYIRTSLANPNMEKSILDHWNSFFTDLRKATSNPNIPLAITGTGIFNAWHLLYVNGTQLGPATSYEYDSVDWNGNAIRCQDFGSYRIEYYLATGIWHAYGATGQVA